MENYSQGITIANGSRSCVLILHGYSDTPYEFKHVAEAIASIGVDVMVPVLPHHCVSSDELEKVNRAEMWAWLKSEVAKLKQRYAKIILVGHSLGAGAAILAATGGEPIDGLVVSAVNGVPSTKVRFLMRWARAFHVHSFYARYVLLRRIRFDPAYIEWKLARFPRISLHVFSEAIDEIPEYIKDTNRIRVPIMVIHGASDFATKVQRTSDLYFNTVGSTKKVSVIVEDTGHAVFFSPHFDALIKIVKEFIQDVLDRGNEGEVARRFRIGKEISEV
ncbi:MAG: alpha/beta fold hydrolase [Candidatus Lokiarchaeota archaeon]|nr:alpha/beta fold hydrolase [Candidatus Lokiarchaeota archaeon]